MRLPSIYGLLAPLVVGVVVGWPQLVLANTDTTRILMLGDSITAGYGLPQGEAVPDQLERLLLAEGYQVRIINGGVSGDTMAQGQARLNWLLAEKPQVVLVALGANDGLRGLPPSQMAESLDSILKRLQEVGAKVLLVGMEAPRNFGPEYAKAFAAVYRNAAQKYDVAFYPFLLEGVALKPMLNQPDGVHPTAEGAALIAKNLLPFVKNLLP